MTKVECGFCGLPFSVCVPKEGVTYYCCSGCALASRIPMDGSSFPVSRGLIIALVLGFGLFNEILFGALGAAVSAEGREDVGALAQTISLALGGCLLLAALLLVLAARPRRWTDTAVGVVALAIGGGTVFWSLRSGDQVSSVWTLVAVDLFLGAWLSRGWMRRSLRRRRRNGT